MTQTPLFIQKNARVKDALQRHEPYWLLMDPEEARVSESTSFILDYGLVQVGNDRIPVPVVLKWYGYSVDQLVEEGKDEGPTLGVAEIIGYEPEVRLSRSARFGRRNSNLLDEMVMLMKASIDNDPKLKGYWQVSKDGQKLTIQVDYSKDPRRNRNGGDYDFYRDFTIRPYGVVSTDEWSADFYLEPNETVYQINLTTLTAIAAQAEKITRAIMAGEKTTVCESCGRPYSYGE